MPIFGKLYTSQELQQLLGVNRQRISNIATARGWTGPRPGLYWPEQVELWLRYKGYDPSSLDIITDSDSNR